MAKIHVFTYCSSFPDHPPKSVYFIIRHFNGKCISINSKGYLYLSATCTAIFHLTSNKSMKHMESGECVVPESYNNGARIKLQKNCSDENTRYEQTRMYSTKHLLAGKCWRPSGGSVEPKEGTYVILHSRCDETRSIFRFEAGE